VLHFLYSDELAIHLSPTNNVNKNQESAHPITDLELFHLLVAAQELELDRLRIMVENYICSHLKLENIIPTVKWAVEKSWKVVEAFSFAFILKNYAQIVVLPDFVTLSPQLLVNIMRLQQQSAISLATTTTVSSIPGSPGSTSTTSSPPQQSQQPPEPLALSIVPTSTLIEDLSSLYADMDFADFLLILGEEKFPVHKCLLAARSEFFNLAFHSGMKETLTRQMTVDISSQSDSASPTKKKAPTPQALRSFLSFIYTDNVEMSVVDAVYCIRLADFYQLSNNKLKSHCIRNIEQNIAPENLLEVLEAADNINSSLLRDLFLQEMVEHYVEVMEKSSYLEHLDKPLLISIMKAVAHQQKAILAN
jgi:hypothetical protein